MAWQLFIQNRADRKAVPAGTVDSEPPWYLNFDGVRHFRYALDTINHTAHYEVKESK